MKAFLKILDKIGMALFYALRAIWGLTISFLRLFKKALHWRNLIHYDNILATGSLLVFLWLFSGINLEVVNPIGDAFSDVELTDLAFSRMSRNSDLREGDYDHLPKLNEDITIVNIGHIPRFKIADVLSYINSFDPKVVAFDVEFKNDHSRLEDDYLKTALNSTKNLVMYGKLYGLDSTYSFDTILYSNPKFLSSNSTSAFLNMVGEDENSYKSGSVTRNFFTHAFNKKTGDTVFSWPVEIVRKYKPEAIDKLLKRNKDEEIIDYVGNIYVRNMLLPDYYNKNIDWEKPHFEAVEYQTILDIVDDTTNQISLSPDLFKDKIVILGYLGDRIDVEQTGEDLFYTPLNERYVGKTPQDMYGVIIHANIIAQILRESYINETNDTFMHVIGLLITYLVFAFYRPIYDDHKVWYDGLTKFLGIALSLIILGFIGMVFDWFNYKIVFGAIWFGCILLAGDWLEIYYGLGKNLFSKLRKTKIQQS